MNCSSRSQIKSTWPRVWARVRVWVRVRVRVRGQGWGWAER